MTDGTAELTVELGWGQINDGVQRPGRRGSREGGDWGGPGLDLLLTTEQDLQTCKRNVTIARAGGWALQCLPRWPRKH